MARKPRMTKLTKRRLEAICEALNARLAGAIEGVDPLERDDYELAWEWATEELDRRKRRT
jgi:hypothetical protein